MSSFVHLRAHSQYSILDATASVNDLVQKASENRMSALALTDHGNLYGAVEFYKSCKEHKIKAVIGCELYLAPQSRLNKTRLPGLRAAYNLPLLAKNKQGYKHLCKLSSIGYLEGFYYFPRIDHSLLTEYREGLICLDGSLWTRLAHEILQGSEESVQAYLKTALDLFGDDYYLDLQRHSMDPEEIQLDGMQQESWLIQQYQDYISRQQKLNEALVRLSRQHNIPLVATNDVHYIHREDWRAHEILLNIQSGEPCEVWEKDAYGNLKFRLPNPKRQTYSTHTLDFKSSEEMSTLFSDFPEAIAQTVKIAEKCHLEIDFKTKHYPIYTPPAVAQIPQTEKEQHEAVEKFLWQLCEEGIPFRYTADRLAKVKEIYPDRDP